MEKEKTDEMEVAT